MFVLFERRSTAPPPDSDNDINLHYENLSLCFSALASSRIFTSTAVCGNLEFVNIYSATISEAEESALCVALTDFSFGIELRIKEACEESPKCDKFLSGKLSFTFDARNLS